MTTPCSTSLETPGVAAHTAVVASDRRPSPRTSKPSSAPAARRGQPGPSASAPEVPDPFGPAQRKQLLLRLGLPVAAVWLIGGLIAGVAQSSAVRWSALAVPLLASLVVLGLLLYVARQAKKARGVANILRGVETSENRQAALARLDADYKGTDPAAVFAKAQLLMQDDPRQALAELEKIDLGKVLAPVADEARAQRAMLHLMLGEVSPARQLADGVGLNRHDDARTRAMLSAVVAEAWARSGDAKKAQDTLALFDPEEGALAPVRPQLYRALAFTAAHVNDVKAMRRALRKLAAQDARILGGFLMKRTHPLLQREAKRLLEQSGAVQRRVQVQR